MRNLYSKKEWEKSYKNFDNFLFLPHEEVVRFSSKYIRKKIGVNKYKNLTENINEKSILDLGCGIGRHAIFFDDLGLNSFGIDLSEEAILFSKKWAIDLNKRELEKRLIQGNIKNLPWKDSFFDFAVSHGVLDSMQFEIAKDACKELSRVLKPSGLFYCDLISGDDSHHSREYSGEEIIKTLHEEGTIQTFYNFEKIKDLLVNCFCIEECFLIRRENILNGGYSSRYHLVLKKL